MKYIKLFRTLAIALTLALLVTAMIATAALGGDDRYVAYTPWYGHVGDTVTVSGVNWEFATYSIIFAYGSSYSQTITTGSVLPGGMISTSFTVPECPQGTYTIWVETVFEDSGNIFRVDPQISLGESSGYVGDEITVSGTGFAADESVTIYLDDEEAGTTESNSLGSFTDVTFTVPESYHGSHTLKVRDASDNYDTATFSTKHSMTISPTSGAIGSEVAVSGTGFKANEGITITFDGSEVATSPASVTTNSKGSFSASFSVPAASSGSHKVEASDGTNKGSQTFTTILATASFSPLEGYVGDEVTVSGTGFQASQPVTITFYNENVTSGYTSNSGSFNISFTVPALPAGTYRVRVSDGINTEENYFTLRTSADISPKTSEASPGHVGTKVTVSGVGFVAGRTVTINYDDTQVTLTTVNTDGTFSATFTVPASSAGEHSIIATDLTNVKQFTFTMESEAPPTPQPLEPETDIEAEAEAYFDWEDVTDPSGVTYTLQIATDEDFAEGSIVLEKTGLIQSEYTITEEEKLESVSQEAPYYWRVRAIDGAFNEGQWSGTRSFHVIGAGFSLALPQPLIYTLFGIGALLLGIFGFWLGRKTAYY